MVENMPPSQRDYNLRIAAKQQNFKRTCHLPFQMAWYQNWFSVRIENTMAECNEETEVDPDTVMVISVEQLETDHWEEAPPNTLLEVDLEMCVEYGFTDF